VNHRDKQWAEQVVAANQGSQGGPGYDVEFGASLTEVLELVRTSGVIVSYSSTRVAGAPRFRSTAMMAWT
jgi:hypothetical protein